MARFLTGRSTVLLLVWTKKDSKKKHFVAKKNKRFWNLKQRKNALHNTCTRLNGEIRAKFEKKWKSFWQSEKSTLVLVIDLG